MSSIVQDTETAASWIASALQESGYAADFSLKSLSEIDRFFDEHCVNGQPRPGGLLAEGLGSRLFAMGAYVGEVLRRTSGGEWVGDDNDPQAEINITLRAMGGLEAWPVQRVMKRFRNGSEDSIAPYGQAFLQHAGIAGAPPADQQAGERSASFSEKKPWWKVW